MQVGSHGHQNVKTQRFAELRQFNEKYGGDHAQGQMLRHCQSLSLRFSVRARSIINGVYQHF